MAYKAHKKQAAAHQAFMQDGFKRGVLLFGRQTGKTYFSVNHAWISAVLNQGRYFIVFKTYKQAHEVVWRQYVPLIPKELIYKKNEQDLLIELNYVKNSPVTLPGGQTIIVNHDESKPRSTIQLLGSDQADSHRGFRAHGIIFDEYGDQDAENYNTVYEPMFSTTDGWAIFMGTPRGYNHFYDLIQYAKDDPTWFYLEATWRDSPYVTEEFMDRVRADAEKRGQLSAFMQEYELEFRSVQGAVYPDLNRDVHVIKPADIPEDLTYYAAIDFGWHTTAFLLFGVDKDQTWYVVDEVYGKEETLDNVIPRIQNVIGDKRIVLMVGDSAARDAIEVMGRSFPIIGVNKANDEKGYATGIGLITEKLKPRMQLVGPPKPSLFIGSNCKHFIFEMESYRFPEEKKERNPTDIPIKENDHGCFTADTIVKGRPIGEWGQFMGEKPVWEYLIAGTKLKATPDHPVLTHRGIVRIDALRYADIICKDKLFTTVSSGINPKVIVNGLIGLTISAQKRQIQALVRDYTAMSGVKRTVPSLLGITYITVMAMLRIMTYPILNALLALNTLQYMLKTQGVGKRLVSTFIPPLKPLRSGLKHLRDNDFAVRWVSGTLSTYPGTRLNASATSAVKPISPKPRWVSSATQTVKPLRYVGVVKTYNIATGSGSYTANGVLVSNCDAARYLFLHLKFGLVKDDKPISFEMGKQLNEFGLI